MSNEQLGRWPRAIAAMFILMAVLAACKSDTTNVAPLVATSIVANAGSQGQTGTVGAALAVPETVTVTDQNGNALSGGTVTWTIIDNDGSVSSATSTTSANGTATVTWTLGTVARLDSLAASLASGTSATITATAAAGAPTAATKVSGDQQTVVSGTTSQPFVVSVADTYGNPVAGVIITWAETGGGALSATSTTTGANGQAQVTLTLGTTPGSYAITATAGTLAAVTFTLTGT